MGLSYQLELLYDEKWSKLNEALKAHEIAIRTPFLLSLNKYDEGDTEKWYTDADLKVMIFGQEGNRWELPADKRPIPADIMEMYQEFYNENYKEDATGKIKFPGRSSFFKLGFNHFTNSIFDFLREEFPTKRAAFLWNNISKLAAVGRNGTGVSVNSFTHQLEQEFFRVIPDEIEILKPDVLIFLTGVDEKYNRYIAENFVIRDNPIQLSGLPIKDVAKLDIESVKLAYRTHHPADRSARDDRQMWYHAILDDLKSNLREILGE